MPKLFQQSEGTGAQRRWFFACVDDTDGKTPETGLTFSGAELQISKNGAAFGNFAGTATELTDGMYYYEATSGELDTLGAVGFKVEKSGVRLVLMEVGQVIPWDPYLDFTALIDTEVAAIKAKTDNLPNDPADASDIAALFATVNTKLDTIDDFVDTEIADIQARLPAALVGGKMDASVGSLGADAITATSIQDNAITAAKIATGAIDADALATDAVTEIVNAVWAYVAEGSYTAADLLRGIASVSFGLLDGLTGAVRTFRDLGDTKDRVVTTVSQHGRTNVVLDLS